MAAGGAAEVRVVSIAGTQLAVQRGLFNAGTQYIDLDLRGLASGIYLLEVQTDDAVGVQRLVIER
jgi:hypothetical protein